MALCRATTTPPCRTARRTGAHPGRRNFLFSFRPSVAALIMLAGLYYGAQYGGSTTAILVNLPGESSSVVTVIDGYQMARKGRAGPALAAAGIGSFFAGCVGTVILAAFAPPLTEVAFKFGPAEYFSLMTLGLIGAVVLASGSLLKAIAMIVLGLLLGIVGTDVNSGVARFSFDIALFGSAWPRKMGLNWFMPAFANNSVGSLSGATGDEGTWEFVVVVCRGS